MKKEAIHLMISDPTGMGWLEISAVGDEGEVRELFDDWPLANNIKYTFCSRCNKSRDCSGVENISQPYNRLERLSEDGDLELISTDCSLNGQRIKYTPRDRI